MLDKMLLAVLRQPPESWNDCLMDMSQRYEIYLEAADKIEALTQFIKNGVELGYISIPEKPYTMRKIIELVMESSE